MPQKRVYNKPYMPPAAIVQHLQTKGLAFTPPYDQQRAADVLSKINYYRFKAYLIPALIPNTKTFAPGSEFSQGIALYDFDSELRALCKKYILKIEVKLRSQLDQVITASTNNPFWYLHNQYFKKNIDYVRTKIATSIRGSTDQFAKHFRDNYLSNIAYYEDLPPFWIAAELTTFGMLTSIMEALDKNQFGPQRSNHLDILAQRFRAATWSDLLSWLQLIKAIRNCASHSNRTWNRNYRLPSGLIGNPQHLLMQPTMSNKIYPGLTIIYLMTKNNLLNGNCFKQELQTLLGRFAHIQNLEYRMGMPANWDREPAWQ